VIDEIEMHTGFTETELKKDLKEKEVILKWLLDKQIKDVESVGKVVSEYYRDQERILSIAKSGGEYSDV
jgi:flagellar protein FlaI